MDESNPAKTRPRRKKKALVTPEPAPAAEETDLSAEIRALRFSYHKVVEIAQSTERTLDEWLEALDGLGAASNRLARLLEAQIRLNKPDGEKASELSELSAQITKMAETFKKEADQDGADVGKILERAVDGGA